MKDLTKCLLFQLIILSGSNLFGQCFPNDGAGYYTEVLPNELGSVYDMSVSSNGTVAIIGKNGISFLESNGKEPTERFFISFMSLGINPNDIDLFSIQYRYSGYEPVLLSYGRPKIEINNGEQALAAFNLSGVPHFIFFYRSATEWEVAINSSFPGSFYFSSLSLGAFNPITGCSYSVISLLDTDYHDNSKLVVFSFCKVGNEHQISVEASNISVIGLAYYVELERAPTAGQLSTIVASTLTWQPNYNRYEYGPIRIISDDGGVWSTKDSKNFIEVRYPFHLDIGSGQMTIKGYWAEGIGSIASEWVFYQKYTSASFEPSDYSFNIPLALGCESIRKFYNFSRSGNLYYYQLSYDNIFPAPPAKRIIFAIDPSGGSIKPEGLRELYLPQSALDGLDFFRSGGRSVAAIKDDILMHWDITFIGSPIPAGARTISEPDNTEPGTIVYGKVNSPKILYRSTTYEGDAVLSQYTVDGKELGHTQVYLIKGSNELDLPLASTKGLTIILLSDMSGKKLWGTKMILQ